MILCSNLREEDIVRKIQSSKDPPKQSLTSPEKNREDLAYKKYLELATEKKRFEEDSESGNREKCSTRFDENMSKFEEVCKNAQNEDPGGRCAKSNVTRWC